ncbi:MAG: phosphatidate cytidylyltransferase [Desulfobulbus propionicus]|nr:MAG: phosphatidate cytidylyltransferase [Desulfobulbus propionicus]
MNRVVPGMLMAGAWVGLLLLAPLGVFWCVVVVIATLALGEFFRLGKAFQQRLLLNGAVLTGILPVIFSLGATPAWLAAGMTASLVLGMIFCLAFFTRLDDPLTVLGHTGFAAFYLSLTLGHLVLLHALPQGAFWLLVLTAITAGSDTGAYYSGRFFGRRKLCPLISPKKTVAGAVGGVLCGTFAAMAMAWLLAVDTSFFVLLLISPVLVVVGIIGDLAESVLKRAAGVKDSGALLGGHGGVLDRIDSLLLTAPVLYYCLLAGIL